MGLIKSSSSSSSSSSSKTHNAVLRFALPDLEQQARDAVAQAQAEAERIIADAHARAAGIESAAREQGQADGWQQGHSDGIDSGASEALDRRADELRQVIETLNAAAAALHSFRAEVEAAATRDAVELALAVAERITKRQGAIDPAVLTENVYAAIAVVGRTAVTRVAVHPSQRAALLAALPQLQMEAPSLSSAEIVDEDTLTPGGCRIFTSHGSVDADLRTQLDRVVDRLLPDRAAEKRTLWDTLS